VLVHPDPAALADLQTGGLRQRGVGAHSEREDDHVGRVDASGPGGHDQRLLVVALCEGGDAVAEDHVDAVEAHPVGYRPAELRVEGREQLGAQLDDGDLEALLHQVLGRLQADEPAADHHGAPRGPDHLEAGVLRHPAEEGRAVLDPLPDRPRVRNRTDLEDAGQIDPGDRRVDGRRAGREHERVVGLRAHLTRAHVTQLHGPLRR